LGSGLPPCWVARRVAIKISGDGLRYDSRSVYKDRSTSDEQSASMADERSSCRLIDKAES
jgi:hypothetical protein